jgi:hypothetical protein
MVEKLEKYLEEIDHYLAVEKGSAEILSEIKSHILDKTEHDYGEINENTINKTIENYGTPRDVAEKYLEGYQLISPSYKKYLFRYAWILFGFHYGLIILCYIFNMQIQIFPFFLIPRMYNITDLIFQLPMTLIFDWGLVGIFFYFLTQERKDLKLIWPKFFKLVHAKVQKKDSSPKEPKIMALVFMTAAFSLVLYFFIRHGTLFIKSFDLSEPIEPLFKPVASIVYSLFVIFLFALEVICYGIRFFFNKHWVNLMKNGAYLIVLWWILNNPLLENSLIELPFLEVSEFFGSIIVVIIVIVLIDTVEILFKIVRDQLPEK